MTLTESPVHRRLRLVRLAHKGVSDVTIDGLEHLSMQITNLHERMVLMVDTMEYMAKVQDSIITVLEERS